MEDREYQKKNLEAIYNAASLSPVFKQNTRYCIGRYADLTPYISYGDVMNHKLIIRGRSKTEQSSFDTQESEIIVEYNSIEELVNDGWRLD